MEWDVGEERLRDELDNFVTLFYGERISSFNLNIICPRVVPKTSKIS